MARKPKQQTPSKVKPTAETVEASSLRPQESPTTTEQATQTILSTRTSRALCLVILASLYAPLSQLTLAPIYGAIPASTFHKYVLIGSALVAFALRGMLPRWADRCLPLLAFYIPTIQYVMFSFSSVLGNPVGPLATELATVAPLIALTLYVATKMLEGMNLSFLNSEAVEEAAPSMVCYLVFNLVQRVFKDVLPSLNGFSYITSRVGLQLSIGVIYGLLLPKSLFWPALPSIAVTMALNTHNTLQRTTDILNNTLALQQYSLLDRYESVTGYISVLEDKQKQFRVMRCDHSLLGGQWLDEPSKVISRRVAEPIYAVFTMMEAVRLVEPPKSLGQKPSDQKRALNIGLGIGTAPAALIAHGIDTTVVELDPAVHHLAIKHFGFPTNHTLYLGDANAFVQSKGANLAEGEKYDYILHDVFTGGAVPTSLFTQEFFKSLAGFLRSDGTIAINYAGDLNLYSVALIHNTIKSVFPNCRIFREEPESDPKGLRDFTNLVYFCTHPLNSEPIKFRKAVTADYLGSGARKEFLVPKHELDPTAKFAIDAGVVTVGNKAHQQLIKFQAQSALGHWHLMRTVIPDIVWENW